MAIGFKIFCNIVKYYDTIPHIVFRFQKITQNIVSRHLVTFRCLKRESSANLELPPQLLMRRTNNPLYGLRTELAYGKGFSRKMHEPGDLPIIVVSIFSGDGEGETVALNLYRQINSQLGIMMPKMRFLPFNRLFSVEGRFFLCLTLFAGN